MQQKGYVSEIRFRLFPNNFQKFIQSQRGDPADKMTYLKVGGLVDGHRGLDEPDNRHAVPPGVRDGEVPVEHAEQVVQVSGVL